jgi:hypothetical protein
MRSMVEGGLHLRPGPMTASTTTLRVAVPFPYRGGLKKDTNDSP